MPGLSTTTEIVTGSPGPTSARSGMSANPKVKASIIGGAGNCVSIGNYTKNRDLAVKRVKGILLLEEIAEKEKIDVTDQELSASIAAMAKGAGQTSDAVRKHYESQDGGLDNLRASLVQEKTLGLLLSRTKKSYNKLRE